VASFVTGGTGFIGRVLVRKLLERGETVHLLCRRTSDLSGLTDEGIRTFYGDVTDSSSLRQPMRGCEGVYHLAGYARNWAPDPSVYYEINVGGLRNVAEAALDCGVRRVVFTSTCLTLGPSREGVAHERTQRGPEPPLTEYERTKLLAEREAAAFAARGLDIVIVNPTRVYGPGKMTEGNSVTRMVQMFMEGRWPFVPGNGEQVGNYAYVDDVAEGHIRAMERGRAGQRYVLGGQNASFNEFFAVLARLTGRRPPRHLPACVARLFARLELLRARVFGGYPLITPGWMETFLRDWAFSNARARQELGCPFRGLEEGLKATCEWLAARKETQ